LVTAETEGPKRRERVTRRVEETRMDPRGLGQGQVWSQEVTMAIQRCIMPI
jgi:hypothetical protein